MPIVDPRSWQYLSWGDLTAWIDFLGAHDIQMREFAAAAASLKSATVPVLPLGDGSLVEPLLGQPLVFRPPTWDWHHSHQAMHDAIDSAMGVNRIDLTGYDLSDPNDFVTWAWLHGGLHVTERTPLKL